ncbi:hypothetical protein SEEC0006_22615 [Salmonella enterica subsp. enterica serovar Choleraesuis str. 0006]|nr:hypothetical protein SEEK9263_11600 [Salmonella enterica subsp. enterica serovar Kentucky str. ATCC 9263]ESH41387.1 hypothetical protein SEEC0006_22615 [Salmonella enterica subsp. enterica serovar Choleraesuis str. 0006]
MEGIRAGNRGNTERLRPHLLRFLRQLIFQRAQIRAAIRGNGAELLLTFWRCLNFNGGEAGE